MYSRNARLASVNIALDRGTDLILHREGSFGGQNQNPSQNLHCKTDVRHEFGSDAALYQITFIWDFVLFTAR